MIFLGNPLKAGTKTNHKPNPHMTPGRIRDLATLMAGERYKHYDLPKQ